MMKNFKICMLAVFSISAFISCDTNDYEEPEFQAMVDIFVRNMKNGDEEVYAPVLYVYANEALYGTTVTLTGESTPAYELVDFFGGEKVLRSVPDSTDFTTADIENGIYEFEITGTSNEILNVKDKLLESRMEAMEITEFTYNKDLHKFEISWNNIEKADVYVVKIMTKADGEYLYISERLDTNSFSFQTGSSGWIDDFVKKSGTTYTLGVFAYEFESENATSGYDINGETVEYREIVW